MICLGWDVKDVAAHVLGDHVRWLSRHRDGYPPPHPRGGEAFPAFLDRVNDEWVTATRRISPRLLVEQLSVIRDQGGPAFRRRHICQCSHDPSCKR
jgi:hypothetical protein